MRKQDELATRKAMRRHRRPNTVGEVQADVRIQGVVHGGLISKAALEEAAVRNREMMEKKTKITGFGDWGPKREFKRQAQTADLQSLSSKAYMSGRVSRTADGKVRGLPPAQLMGIGVDQRLLERREVDHDVRLRGLPPLGAEEAEYRLPLSPIDTFRVKLAEEDQEIRKLRNVKDPINYSPKFFF